MYLSLGPGSKVLRPTEPIVQGLLNCRTINLRSSMLLGCFPTFVVGSLSSRMHPVAPKAVCEGPWNRLGLRPCKALVTYSLIRSTWKVSHSESRQTLQVPTPSLPGLLTLDQAALARFVYNPIWVSSAGIICKLGLIIVVCRSKPC